MGSFMLPIHRKKIHLRSSKISLILKNFDEFSMFSSIFNHKSEEFLKFQIFAILKKQKN